MPTLILFLLKSFINESDNSDRCVAKSLPGFKNSIFVQREGEGGDGQEIQHSYVQIEEGGAIAPHAILETRTYNKVGIGEYCC